jgi:hypothetical protein
VPDLPDLPAPLTRRMRTAVLDLREGSPRSGFELRLHVADFLSHLERGLPGDHDLGLRTDVMTAMLARLDPAAHLGARRRPVLAAWVTRPGGLDPHESDFAWALASRQAAAALELPVEFFAVTRSGWHHPTSGAVRRWTRLRRTTTAAA